MDNGQSFTGVFDADFTSVNWTAGPARGAMGNSTWRRLPDAGRPSSISLDACRGGAATAVLNLGGHLNCDWKVLACSLRQPDLQSLVFAHCVGGCI